jgi:protein required for attachment to host cells
MGIRPGARRAAPSDARERFVMRQRKPVTWILVADGARARVFAANRPGKGLREALPMAFVGVNLPARARAHDRPGRAFDRFGPGRHDLRGNANPHGRAKTALARDVARHLEDAARRARFDRLVVVAPPRALGEVRAALGPEAARRVVAEVGKDLSRLPKARIVPHLSPRLHPAVRP